jgi:hypothetical protein
VNTFEVKILNTNGTIDGYLMTDENESKNADTLREIVGGWLQLLTLVHPETGEVACLWMDEEGKYKDSPVPNILANTLLSIARVQLMPGDFVVGPCVLTGVERRHGAEGEFTAALPKGWADVVDRIAKVIEEDR